MVKFFAEDEKKYPKFVDWVKSDITKVFERPNVLEAFTEITKSSKKAAVDLVQHKVRGILIEVKSLGPLNAKYDYDVPGKITIASELVDRFEKVDQSDKMKTLLEAKILHELVHSAQHDTMPDFRPTQIPGDPNEDPGKDLEIRIYQEVKNRFWPSGGGASTPPDPAVPEPEPVGNVPFAALPDAPGGAFHWPVVTRDPQRLEVAYRALTGEDIGRAGRRFMADRSGGARFHVGIDLFGAVGDPVVAMMDGTIVGFHHFLEGTFALLAAHGDIVVNYGEVASDSLARRNLDIGATVVAGQEIGELGFSGNDNAMCHFETYRAGTTQTTSWPKTEAAPGAVLNPTKLLLALRASADGG